MARAAAAALAALAAALLASPALGKEGPESRNPLAFKYYDAEEEILGKPMKEWLRFSVAYWHSFRGDGADQFGAPTRQWPWEDGTNTIHMALRRMKASFEFLRKLGVEHWCFHDRDIAPEGATLEESNSNLDKVVKLAKELQDDGETKIRPLWGTAQLFKHPRYMHGAATRQAKEAGQTALPNVTVFAYAAAQVKKAMEVTKELGGENFVFWGGREGYQSLLNTDMRRELDHQAIFLRMAVAYKKLLGFNGTLLLEPKPQEPTKHQYDHDAATTLSFLLQHGLAEHFKLNIECNHATLSGHSCFHELEVSRIAGVLGSIDANTGDAQTGWDTDQFLIDPLETTLVMLSAIKNGGLAPGGINFDAKLRRESTDPEDLFIAHISSMDALARGLRNAARLHEEGELHKLLQARYESFESELGIQVEQGLVGFKELEAVALAANGEEVKPASGKQEKAEAILLSVL
eukprot:SM000174S03374  [mRNA]  locus=s174:205911:209884:- [translate_table: standard]